MKNKAILIVDDHADFRETLKVFIEKQFQDVAIKEAGNGEIGVDMAVKEKADVCLVDISLPGIDGLETARRIKHSHPDCRILVMSMFHQHSLEEMIKEKITTFVNKNKIDSELIPLLHKCLGGT